MAFRTDYQDFPFISKDRAVWYFVVNWEQKNKKEFCTVQEKRELVSYLREIISNQNNYELLGVWNGQYKTDIFVIPIEEGYNKLKEYFPEN